MRFFYLSDQNEQQYRGRPLLGTLNSFTKEGFQTNADKVALSANQILCPRAPSNLRAISKYQFEISSLDLSLTKCNRWRRYHFSVNFWQFFIQNFVKRTLATFSTFDKEFVNLRTSPFIAWLSMLAQPFQISSRIVSPGPTSWYLKSKFFKKKNVYVKNFRKQTYQEYICQKAQCWTS